MAEPRTPSVHRRQRVGLLAEGSLVLTLGFLVLGGCASTGSSSGRLAPTGTPSPPVALTSVAASAVPEPSALNSVGAGTAPCVSATNPGLLCGGGPVVPPPAGSTSLPSAPPAIRTPARSTPAGTRATTPVPRAVPTGTPTPSPAQLAAMPLVVTERDNGTTLHLVVGQRFILDLGQRVEWAVKATVPQVVQQVAGAPMIAGAQGLYAARATGTTVITAIGSPPCASGSVCPLFRLGFSLTIVVG